MPYMPRFLFVLASGDNKRLTGNTNALDRTIRAGHRHRYTKELYEAKCSAVFEHVYQSYQGEGLSVYAA
jgi:hypothetical protein